MKKQSILGSFASVQTIIVIVMIIIDLVQTDDGSQYYDDLASDANRIALSDKVLCMVYVRNSIAILQALSILLTWMNQYFTDSYLITTPLTFFFFVIIISLTIHWSDIRSFDLEEEHAEDEVLKNAHHFLSNSLLSLVLNTILSAFTHAINYYI